MKRNKIFKLGLALMLIPFIIGAIFYNDLPDVIATHFDSANNPNGYSSKFFALFGLPAIMVLVYIVAYLFTNLDPRRKYQGDKAMSVVLLFIPLLDIFISLFVIGYAKGYKINISKLVPVAISILFIFIGNYLPKTKRNYTIGIKLPWTLDSDYVWDKTHALAGKVWIICGLLGVFVSLFKPEIFFGLVVIMVLVPTIYSYIVYKSIK